jgi:hypothetical protein
MEDLQERCLKRLRDLPFVRAATLAKPQRSSEYGVEKRLALETAAGRRVMPCEIYVSHLRRETAQFLIHTGRRRQGLIVFAPRIGRDLGDLFEHASVNFVDAAGNCYLHLSDNYVARFQGRSAAPQARTDRGLRAPAYRALFGLLVKPDLVDTTSRGIAAAVDVSPQTANELRHRLVTQGLVLKAGGRWRWGPGGRKDAVALWLAGFAATLAPSLVIGRFRAKETDPRELERRLEPLLDGACEWRYGGGAAAERLTGHYRGDRTILYLHNAPEDLWTRVRLVRDVSGPIILARAPGALAFESPQARCVHPLLAYADLLAEGHERARDAAGELQSRFLTHLDDAG